MDFQCKIPTDDETSTFFENEACPLNPLNAIPEYRSSICVIICVITQICASHYFLKLPGYLLLGSSI